MDSQASGLARFRSVDPLLPGARRWTQDSSVCAWAQDVNQELKLPFWIWVEAEHLHSFCALGCCCGVRLTLPVQGYPSEDVRLP